MSKIYVSYYGCKRSEVIEKAFKVQISMNKPKEFMVNVNWRRVAPQWNSLLGPYKAGQISDEEYSVIYKRDYLERYRDEIIKEMRWILAAAKNHDVVMFCYCYPGSFCHRYLLKDFLCECGFEVEELR